jgi:hypothetical protein
MTAGAKRGTSRTCAASLMMARWRASNSHIAPRLDRHHQPRDPLRDVLLFARQLTLHIRDCHSGGSTFTATLGSSAAPVPEPASIMVLGTGLVTLVGRRFRRSRTL